MDILFTFAIPLTFIFSGFYIIRRIKEFNSLSGWMMLAVSPLISLSIVTSVSVVTGFFIPGFFILGSKLLFILLAFLSLLTLRNSHTIFRNLSSSFVNLPIIQIVGVILALFGLLFILRPITDGDIVESYLPLGRSIVKNNSIPYYNFYDSRPFIIPPPGSPLLFAYYYAVSGNLQSEVFRYINIPYLLGYIILSYFLMRKYLTIRESRLSVVLLLTFPFLEDFIFQSSLYPDFIFSYACLAVFYFTLEITSQPRKNHSAWWYLLIGLGLFISVLFKYQAVFLFFLSFSLLVKPFLNKYTKYMILAVMFSPIIFFKYFNIMPYGNADRNIYLFFIFTLILITLKFIQVQSPFVKPGAWGAGRFLLSYIIGITGAIYILRNFLHFHGLNDSSPAYTWAVTVGASIGMLSETGSTLDAWSLFLAPLLSLFWLLPKIAGIVISFLKKEMVIPLFILLSWYAYWVLVLGAQDVKWLFPVLPFVSLVIYIGLKKIFKEFEKIYRAVIHSLFFVLLSSKFIFWNLAALSFGNDHIRNYANQPGEGDISSAVLRIGRGEGDFWESIFSRTDYIPFGNKIISSLIMPLADFFKLSFNSIFRNITDSVYILSSHISLDPRSLNQLLILSVVLFLMIYLMVKTIKNHYFIKAVPIIFISIYLMVIFYVSNGNPFKFSGLEKAALFDYWGQNSALVPFLKGHAGSEDKILTFGTPGGLSYFTDLHTYNLQYGGGVKLFYDIRSVTDLRVIYGFFKQQKIRYICILKYGQSGEDFIKFKDMITAIGIVGDNRYTRIVLQPDKNNFWEVWEVI